METNSSAQEFSRESVAQSTPNIGLGLFFDSSSSLAGLNFVRMAAALGGWSPSTSEPFQTTSTAFIHSLERATTQTKRLRVGHVLLKREARILQAETELMSFRMGKG